MKLKILRAAILISLFVTGCASHESAVVPEPSAADLPPAKDMLFWKPDQQAVAFKNFDRLYASRTVAHGRAVRALPRDAELKVTYEESGGVRTTEDFIRDNRTFGLLVVHEGRIKIERYDKGFTPRDRWTSYSVSKSMTSTLVGAAIADGKISSVDDQVTRYVPELKGSGYEGVTIRQVLNMSSGVKWNENYRDRESDTNFIVNVLAERRSGALLAHEKDLPRAWAPDSKFEYNSGNTHVLGAVVTNATGVPLADYLSQKVWRPAGMEADAAWTMDGDQGVEFAGCCVNATLRDFGRFGLFALENGQRGSTRILPPGWIEAATKGSPANPGYSFQWWVKDGKEMFQALGVFGQIVLVSPKDRAVIVVLSAWPEPIDQACMDRFDRYAAAVLKRLR